MGRRSRKRATTAAGAERAPRGDAATPTGADAAPAPVRPRRAATPAQSRNAARPRGGRRRAEPPPAPWGKFPLVELCVLMALVLGVWGFAKGGRQGGVMMAAAAALGSLAGLEVAVREHFAGYKPHSTVLGASLGVATIAIAVIAGAPQYVMLAAGLFVGVTAFVMFRRAYQRREGLS